MNKQNKFAGKMLSDIFPNGITADGNGNILTEPVLPHTYQSKPKTVTAIQLTEENFAEIEKKWGKIRKDNGGYYLNYTGDKTRINIGDWIVENDHSFAVLSDEDFREEYEVNG